MLTRYEHNNVSLLSMIKICIDYFLTFISIYSICSFQVDVDELPLNSKGEDGFIKEDIDDIVGELELSPIGDELELDDDYFFDDDLSI